MTTDEKSSTASKLLIFLLCAAIVLSALLFGLVDSVTRAGFMLSAGLVGLLWLTDAWKTGELSYSTSFLQLPILGYILIGIIQLLPLRQVQLPENLLSQPVSNTLSLDAFATRLAVLLAAAMFIYFAAALTFINNQKRLQAVTLTIVIFGFALAVYSIIQYFGSEGKIYWIREPVQAFPMGPFVNRHHFGGFMEMTMGLTLGLLYTGAVRREQRGLYIFAVIIMGVGLIMTGSRGALLSFFGLLAFLTAATFLGSRKAGFADEQKTGNKSFLIYRLSLLGGGLALVLLIFGTVLLLGNDELLARSVGAMGGAGDVSSGRLQFWQGTLQMIRDFPFWGVGLDAFGVAYTRYDPWNGTLRIEHSHNEFLQVLAEAGIGGLILVLAFIFSLFRRGLQVFTGTRDNFRRGACIGALAGCFGIIIHSFFDFPLRTSSNLLLFLTLAAIATVHINPPKHHRKHSKNRASQLNSKDGE